MRKRATEPISEAELEEKLERVALREEPRASATAPPSFAELCWHYESLNLRVEFPVK